MPLENTLYIDLVIKQEEEKAEILRDSDLLKQLKKLRAEYEKEKLIWDDAVDTGIRATCKQVMRFKKSCSN